MKKHARFDPWVTRSCYVAVVLTVTGCSGTPSSSGQTSIGGSSLGGSSSIGGTAAIPTGGRASMGGATTGGAASSTGGSAAAGSTSTGCVGSFCGFCPPSPPPNGSACSFPSGYTSWYCTWGDHPDTDCRTTGSCTGTWAITLPSSSCTTLPTGCGATKDAICTGVAYGCIYSDGTTCGCSTVGQPGVCTAPVTLPPPCPAVIPNEGEPCNLADGTKCTTRVCDGTTPGFGGAQCSQGVWSWIYCLTHVCASPDTPIATPLGERPISNIQVGDWVYSVDGDSIRAVKVVRVRRQRASDHRVMRVVTADGRTLEISAPHPTADGRTFGDLRPGGLLDGHPLQSVEVVDYKHDYTYDILPASTSGYYFAAGLLIGSTIAPDSNQPAWAVVPSP